MWSYGVALLKFWVVLEPQPTVVRGKSWFCAQKRLQMVLRGVFVVPGIETWSQLKLLHTKALSLDLSLASILREINQ